MGLSKAVVKNRVLILMIALILLVPAVFGMLGTRINYDMLDYLPGDMDTVIGQETLKEDFGKGAFSFIVVQDMPVQEVAQLKEKIQQVDHVESVLWYDSVADLSIPMELLPTPVPSSQVYGAVNLQGVEVPIAGMAGDQQAALFGQACFTPGQAKNTYGTGCFTLMNVGGEPVASQSGLVTSVAWSLGGETTYALEGSVFNAGSTIQWLRDELGLISSAPECDRLAESVPDAGGVYVVPAFTGLGAPYWDMYARGTIVGLTRGVNKNHIIRATLDSLCYQINDVLAAMQADSGIDLTALKVDGGACANNYLLQTMADISDLPVKRPCCVETTALGAAYLAGLAVGYWSSTEDVLQNWSVDREFMPGIPDDERTRRLKGWNKAVRCSYGWAKEE